MMNCEEEVVRGNKIQGGWCCKGLGVVCHEKGPSPQVQQQQSEATVRQGQQQNISSTSSTTPTPAAATMSHVTHASLEPSSSPSLTVKRHAWRDEVLGSRWWGGLDVHDEEQLSPDSSQWAHIIMMRISVSVHAAVRVRCDSVREQGRFASGTPPPPPTRLRWSRCCP